jgi:curved DNA-binding protein CbpA
MRISEAYSTLSSPEKRAKYDRDVLGLSRSSSGSHHARRTGSYSSSQANPAGGRPASGLSRRRGTFTGPPPSFYRQGGWGSHGDKRRAAHDESTGGAASGAGGGEARPHQTGPGNTGQWGGMGPGQDPYGHQDDVPHFDKESHEKTGRTVDARRAKRAKMMDEREISFEGERGMGAMFLIISGIVALGVSIPLMFAQLYNANGRGKKDAKGTWDKAVRG